MTIFILYVAGKSFCHCCFILKMLNALIGFLYLIRYILIRYILIRYIC